MKMLLSEDLASDAWLGRMHCCSAYMAAERRSLPCFQHMMESSCADSLSG